MINKKWIFFLIITIFLASGVVLAQIYVSRGGGYGRGGGRSSQGSSFQGGMGRGGGRGGRGFPNQQFLNSRENLFTWPIEPEFKEDAFTFVRIAYSGNSRGRSSFGSYGYRGGGFSSVSSVVGSVCVGGSGIPESLGSRWETDFPDSDNNFSYRLHQVTSIEVNPEPVFMELTNPHLYEYPFIYMVEPGSLYLNDEEVKILRKYLLNGGFLMLDDFWGLQEWANVYSQMKKVFPEREPQRLTLDHPIFHSVFEIKEFPQIPAINYAITSGDRLSGRTSESGLPPNYYGIFDDKGRMMVIIDRDSDLGDGWEREGESHTFFSEFSEKQAYPMGINIIFYVMTH